METNNVECLLDTSDTCASKSKTNKTEFLLEASDDIVVNISIVKISLVFLSQIPIAQFKKNITLNYEGQVMFKKNIIAINCNYILTVFHKPPMKYHVNVTKIKNLSEVDEAIRFVIQNYFNRK